MKETVPVTIMVNKEIYTDYKKKGKSEGFTPRVKLAEQANLFMHKQNNKGG